MSYFSDDGSLPSLDKCSKFELSDNFEVLSKLGSGGFSNVYKVKHKVDKVVYAIKCVKYNSDAAKEVEALARLNNPNIIRYHMCLLPVDVKQYCYKTSSESASTDDGIQFTDQSPVQEQGSKGSASDELNADKLGGDFSHILIKSLDLIKEPESTSSDSSDTSDNSGSKVPSDSSTSGADQKQDSSTSFGAESSESMADSNLRRTPPPVQEQGISESDIAKIKDGKSTEDGSKSSSRNLYIIMEFCEGGTLTTWISERNYKKVERTEEEALSIFHQIVSGMKYVHSKNIIHRDLKPDNIFFGNDGNVKIADFGLATLISGPNGDPIQRTKHVGTETYMSPEQENQTDYDEKTDIFTLGLIWFELLWRMFTEMERIKMLSELKNQTFPDGFCQKYKTQHKYIKQMLSKDPKERPDAEKLENVLKECFPLGPSDSIR
ncbi:protein kinase containing Z-DNA binding domains [Trichomycterus rosablanca]|uniref:protein kinase containing Z-DNA binding domains n=1 Tax=Trichomycterus rosablanca TaxID=2290929 RepID=UPI002F34FC83